MARAFRGRRPARTDRTRPATAPADPRLLIRACQAWLPAGWFIAAVYSDVESGATDLDARSRTDSWRVKHERRGEGP
jgi:hypothetical protein